jgi:hypothetical protein
LEKGSLSAGGRVEQVSEDVPGAEGDDGRGGETSGDGSGASSVDGVDRVQDSIANVCCSYKIRRQNLKRRISISIANTLKN